MTSHLADEDRCESLRFGQRCERGRHVPGHEHFFGLDYFGLVRWYDGEKEARVNGKPGDPGTEMRIYEVAP